MYTQEKTPLRDGSYDYMPYSYDRSRYSDFKRRIKQYQGSICLAILLGFGFALLIAMLGYPEVDVLPIPDSNANLNSLQSALNEGNPVDDVGKVIPGAGTPLNKAEDIDSFDKMLKSIQDNFPTHDELRNNKEVLQEEVLPPLGFQKGTGCVDSKFRTVDGICNNMFHPSLGSSGQPLKRLIPAEFCDGISAPRCSASKTELPSPYFIISQIKSQQDFTSGEKTEEINPALLNYLWAEFISKDIADIPLFGPAGKLNLATSFLDGSNIYGNGTTAERETRSYMNGEILMNAYDETSNPPPKNNREWICKNDTVDTSLFQKVMRKQHNLVASKLKILNPDWVDEKLYQESRRVVIAQIQYVTYNEFLSFVIGEEQIKKYGLEMNATGFVENCNNDLVDPSTSTVFATSAFKSVFAQLMKSRSDISNKRCDFFPMSYSIKRGRDHGIAGYTSWRHFCGLDVPESFEDLTQTIGTNNTELFKKIYSNVSDIDLFVGIISEKPVEGSLLGEVGLCLLVDQFKRFKVGDRYWFEIDKTPQKFSDKQLTEIRKTSLTSLICENIPTNKIYFNGKASLECPIGSAIQLEPWKDSKIVEKSSLKLEMSNMLLQKSAKNNSNIVKTSASFMVTVANLSASMNDNNIYESYNQKPPIMLPLDRVIPPNSYASMANIILSGNINANTFSGTVVLPLYSTDDNPGQPETLTIIFQGDVSFKWGTSIDLKVNKKYNCKVLFQSYTKATNKEIDTNLLKQSNMLSQEISDEKCTVMLVGMFYKRPFYCSIFSWWCQDGKIFFWSGDTKIVLQSTLNKTTDTDLSKLNLSTSLKYKTEDVKVDKHYASITVASGKVSGNLCENCEKTEIFNGSPPLDINLEKVLSPNAYDTSFEVTFSVTPKNDSSLIGKFLVPYFTKEGKKIVSADFNVNFIYKYGGSVDIIDKSKTYVCKVMFPSVKKQPVDIANTEITKIIKGKTPFGESCAITLGGYFQSPSIFCHVTPWWCSNEKVFHWNGDIELTIKNKYNTSDANVIIPKKSVTVNQPPKQVNYYGGKFCCGHRLGGKVRNGWMQIKNSGFFQSYKTIWSGATPASIRLPVFWTPESSSEQVDLSDVFGHEVVWSSSLFHSSIQGSFLLPQIVGHGPTSLVNWIKGKFFIELELEDNTSLYDIVVPGLSYKSRVIFRPTNETDLLPFTGPQKGDIPTEDGTNYGTKAPLLLLGKYTPDRKSFIWNGTFIMIFSKTPQDYKLF